MQSNIMIRSNIYLRKTPNIYDDIEFMSKVTGRPALNKIKDYYSGTLAKYKLTETQENEYSQGASCAYALNKEHTHGKVLCGDKFVWGCRCENTKCNNYSDCINALYSHRIIRSEQTNYNHVLEKFYIPSFERLGIKRNEDDKEDASEDYTTNTDFMPDNFDYNDEVLVQPSHEYIKIEDPEVIITAPINEKIIVNAGPGTGKTYTVIQRIMYILENELAEPNLILVLCYTRAAKDVIMSRVLEAISKGILPINAQDICIVTFDSFATMYLGFLEEDLKGLGYDERISLFNSKVNDENLNHLQYVIIDEIQDLVNQRALMTLRLLESINCAYLLLGDKCQAIYDYDCDDNMFDIDSVEFYKRLESFLPHDIKKYELTKNNRQCYKLASKANDIREALLYFQPIDAFSYIKLLIDELETVYFSELQHCRFDNNTKTAILCRNNGEAHYISSVLKNSKIPHTLLKGSSEKETLARWIADVFWDYHQKYISRKTFIDRYIGRCNDDQFQAEKYFDEILSICGKAKWEEGCDVEQISKALAKPANLPDVFLNKKEEHLVVSTIHKAKGREFDSVFILKDYIKPSLHSTEEARVWYVALTRPISNLALIEKDYPNKWHFKSINRRRFIRTECNYCKNIVIGLPDDVDDAGFVDEDINDPVYIQEYIANNVSVNDKVNIRLDNAKDLYYVYHNEACIGRLTRNIFEDIKYGKRSIPQSMENAFVSNIITVTPRGFSSDIPLYFRESKFWLGIELSGFPKTRYD